ncbi:MAG: putative transcriptional regulator [Clostridium sp.]|jgi:putative transcriptional regulator
MKLKTKELREIKKMSLAKLSRESGVARGYLCELEEGKYKNPGGEVICKICKALKCTPNDLIDKKYWE